MIRIMRILFLLLCCCSLFAAPKAIIFDFGGVVAMSDKQPVLDYIHNTLGTNAVNDFAGEKLYLAISQGEDFWHSYADSHHTELPPGWMTGLNQKVNQMIRPIPGVNALISELKAEGYRVALLSNTTKLRSEFYRKQGLYEPFNPIILSWEVNVSKPDPKIYEIMLQKLDLPAQDCIFIDNTDANVTAAAKLGMHAIRFRSTPQLKRDLSLLLWLKNERTLPDARIGSSSH